MLNASAATPDATEALIVGGGPAGLAAAIALRQRGIGCAVVEARPIAIDKACGEGLMPDSRASLAQLGVTLTQSDGQPFHGIRFANCRHHVDARFPSGEGIGVRRPHLHSLLAARAAESGAHLLWNSHVQLPESSATTRADLAPRELRTAHINGQPIRYRWLIGADGHASTVRRWASLDRTRKRSLRYGFRTHYRVDPATSTFDLVEIHFGHHGQLYITPVAPDCVCVVSLTHTNTTAHLSSNIRANPLAEFPAVAQRLANSEPISTQRGAVSATCKLHRVATSSVALIGDASGSIDSITGEGLALCFRQALALADAIHSGSLAPYHRTHREISKLPHAMGALMLTLDRWPALEVRALRAFAHTPALFRDMLAAHMGEKALASVLLRHGPGFGWSLLARDAHA